MRIKSAFLLVILGVVSILSGCSIVGAPASIAPAIEPMATGDSLLTAGKYIEAIDAYGRVLRADTKSADAYFSRGKAYFLYGNFTAAADDLSASIDLKKNNADALYFRGWAYVANGAIGRANADFSTVISLKPDLAGAYNGRQWCNANIAQWDRDSLLYLYQKLESEAGLSEAYEGKSWDFVKEMQWELILAPDPQTAVKSPPDISEVYCNLGFCCFKKAQWAVAVSELQAAYSKNPDLNKGNWNIDWARGKSKSWDRVIEDNSHIIQMTGKPVGAGLLSTLDSSVGWRDSAIKCYKQAAQERHDSRVAGISATALTSIKTWQKALNIPD